MFSHVTRLEQSRASENIRLIISGRGEASGGGVEGGGRKALSSQASVNCALKFIENDHTNLLIFIYYENFISHVQAVH